MPDLAREILEVNASLQRLRTSLIDQRLYHQIPTPYRLELQDAIVRLTKLEAQIHADRRTGVCVACKFDFEKKHPDDELCAPCVERELRHR